MTTQNQDNSINQNPLSPGGIGRFLGRRSGRGRFDIKDVITYTYLIVGTVVMFGPVLWLVMSSFKDETLLFESNPTFLPYRQVTTEIINETVLEHNPDIYKILVGEARIEVPDILATNGYVQGIDKIILPPEIANAIDALDTEQADLEALPSGIRRVALDDETGNLFATLQDNRDYSIFAELTALTGLDIELADNEALTVLAFDDDAFQTLVRQVGDDEIAALMAPENRPLLLQFMQYHVLEGSFQNIDFFNQRGDSFSTLGGMARRAAVDLSNAFPIYDVTVNTIRLNDAANVVISDLDASNGSVHGVDAVLLTPELESQLNALPQTSDAVDLPNEIVPLAEGEDGNLLEVASSQADLALGGQLFASFDFDGLLNGEDGEDHTLLVPTNAAFEVFLEQYGTAVLQADNIDLLRSILSYHILPDRYRAVNFYRTIGDPAITALDDTPLATSMIASSPQRLAQVGNPRGAEFFFIDPENPDAGVFSAFSFSTPTGITSVVFEPEREVSFAFENYTDPLNLESFRFWTYLKNSVIVTAAATVVTLVINSMAAFGLSKYKFAGRDAVFVIIISTLMVPVSVILIPAFIVISEVGWVNSLWGLIIPGAATPTGVFLLRQYMLTIPDELLDAARMDGASEWRIYWQIILPLARPAMAVLTIFSIMWRWNDFLWPLIVVSRNDKFTLQVGLNAFQGALDVQWHFILAMTVLTLLPITVVFAFLQKYITSGIATTGLK